MLKRSLLALLLILALGLCSRANEKAQGYCYLQNSSTPSLGCTVIVFLTGTTSLATLFADNINTPLSNPFTVSNTSNVWSFYAATARYDVNLSGGNPSVSPSYTISDILLFDPATDNVATATTATTSMNLLGPGSIAGTFSGDPVLSGSLTIPALGTGCLEVVAGLLTNTGAPCASGGNFVALSPIATQTLVQPDGTSTLLTSAGVFTNTQDNQPFTAIINGLSFPAMDPFFLTDAFAGGVEVPSGSAVQQADGLTGGCETQSTITNCVGLFGIGRTRINNGSAWGQNIIVSDVDTLGVHHTGTFLHGVEADVQCTAVTTSCFGFEVFGAVGNATPNVGGGYRLASLSNFGATALWPYGFGSDPGVTNTFAIANTQCTTGTCPSQTIVFYGLNSSTTNGSLIQGTPLGGLTLQPNTGAGVTIGGVVDPRGEIEIDTPGAHVPDALNVNVAHGINMSSISPAVIDLIIGQRADQSTLMTYIQSRNNYGANNVAYPLQLNPLGGNVGINNGTAIPGEPLDVVGLVRSSTGYIIGAGTSANVTQTIASGTTGTITGTSLSATCDSGTVTGLTGATAGMPVTVSTTDGTDVGGAFYLRASVTSTGTVTVYVCGTGTPASKAYNVRVLQ